MEWGHHNPAFLPKASYHQRLGARMTSFATQNIILFPMFSWALDYWFNDHTSGLKEWKKSKKWKNTLAKWSSTIDTVDINGNTVQVPVMARTYL